MVEDMVSGRNPSTIGIITIFTIFLITTTHTSVIVTV
jgi:hypothetical protein